MYTAAVVARSDLRALGKALKTSEAPRRREVYRALDAATRPAKADVAKAAKAILPGGLGDFVADARIATRIRMSGRNVGVRIVASQTKAKSKALRRRAARARTGARRVTAAQMGGMGGGAVDLAAIDRGRARHPYYGRWKPGKYQQRVRPGFFTDTMRGPTGHRASRAVTDAITRNLITVQAHSGRRAA